MSFEVEVKYRTAEGHAELSRRLEALGAHPERPASQVDLYLSHPARDFATTGEAFRIRRIGDENRVTYKGPKRSGPTKTREEIEIPFAAGDGSFEDLRRLFENLGFRPFATVRKSRTPFHLAYGGRPVEVVLDEVDGLGPYLEVETFAEREADLPAAQGAILDLARELGLSQIEPRSYLRLILERDPGVGPATA